MCFVLSIALPKSIMSPGISKNTARRLSTIARMRHSAISLPMPNCMNIIAIRPPTVVSELDEISGIALLSATMSASRMPSVWCSSL